MTESTSSTINQLLEMSSWKTSSLNLLGTYLNLSTQPCLEAAGPLTPGKSPWPAETIGWQCQALCQRSEATGLHACKMMKRLNCKGQVGYKNDPCTISSWTIFHGFCLFFGLLLWCCSKIKGPIFFQFFRGFLWDRSGLHPAPRRWVCSQDSPHLVAATAIVPFWFVESILMTCNESLYYDLYTPR